MSARTPGHARMRPLGTTAPAAVVLIRVVVGGILSPRASKSSCSWPNWDLAGLPRKHLPAPGVLALLDGAFEIGRGVLLMVGLLTRLASLP